MKNYLIEGKAEIERLKFQNEIDVYDINKEADYFKWNTSDVVLDAGCGSGNLIKKLLEKKITSIHGLDMSEDRVKYSMERFKDFHNVKISQGTLENTNLEKKYYDKIICRYIFEHVVNPLSILTELKGLLKSEGSLYIINFDDIFFGFHTKNSKLNDQLKDLKSKLQQDFEIGRKLPQFLKQIGFDKIEWEAETFFFKKKRMTLEKKNTQMRLIQGREHLSKYFKSKEEYDLFAMAYLNEMKDSNNVLFTTKYLIKAHNFSSGKLIRFK
ncbi:MAG: class I SAM-dependent methyltransferase [Bacteriovorax sp.]